MIQSGCSEKVVKENVFKREGSEKLLVESSESV